MRLDDKTIVALARVVCGASIFIVHMLTGYNGSAQILALVLLGVPIESVTVGKRESAQDEA